MRVLTTGFNCVIKLVISNSQSDLNLSVSCLKLKGKRVTDNGQLNYAEMTAIKESSREGSCFFGVINAER